MELSPSTAFQEISLPLPLSLSLFFSGVKQSRSLFSMLSSSSHSFVGPCSYFFSLLFVLKVEILIMEEVIIWGTIRKGTENKTALSHNAFLKKEISGAAAF